MRIEGYIEFLRALFKAIRAGNSFKSSFYQLAKTMLNYEEYPLMYHLSIEALKRYGLVKLLVSELNKFIKDREYAEALAALVVILESNSLRRAINNVLSKYKVPYNANALLEIAIKKLDRMDFMNALAYRYSVPLWFVKYMINLLGKEEALSLLKSFLTRDVIWIRVNTLKISVGDVISSFRRIGIRVERDEDFPILLKVSSKYLRRVATLNMVREFKIFIQDKASVAAVYCLNPEPGETVLDMCAAPGLKTSLIAQLMECKGNIVAIDISKKRINAMRNLIRHLCKRDVEVIIADSRRISITKRFDKVLLDAPCTSSGALLIDPSLRVRLEHCKVDKYREVQRDLLFKALQLGDIVTYCVCSVLPDEGERLIDYVLAKGRASLLDPKIPGSRGYRGFTCSPLVRRYFPHLHKTQGFFIAKLKSVNSL